MIIDTSALVAILDQKPEADRIARAIAAASDRMLSAANLVEAGLVMQARRGDEGRAISISCLRSSRLRLFPSRPQQAEIARKAFRRYGRGRHGAKLNFGDCFAYALANDEQAPLLFKRDDFAQTDVAVMHY
jgi:ribonuclease VapC